MAMPFDYSRNTHRAARPFGEVTPIIDATDAWGAIRQVFDFMVRHQGYVIGVPDTSFFPFSAICHLDLTFPSGSYTGTGFYIGPNLILSAGHNLFDKTPDRSSTESATSVHVRVGRQNTTTWLDEFTVTPETWVVHKNFVDSGATNRGFDLSVIRAPHTPPNGEFFHMINYSPSADTPIAVCGHGGEDVDSDRQHLDIDKVRAISADLDCVQYNLQTRKGNSGSPVFAHFDNAASGSAPDSIPVMAVHVSSSGSQLNNGCLLTPDKADWALSGGLLYPAPAVTHSLSATRGSLGGLPLVARPRTQLGGLPLQGAAQPMARHRAMSWGANVRPFSRSWIVIDTGASGGMSTARRTFGHPTHDLSGKTTLSVRVPNIPSGGSVRWNIPDAIDQTRAIFEVGSSTSHSVGGTTVTLQSIGAGAFAVDCMVKDAGGTTVESNKYWMSSPQFIFVAIDPSTDAFFAGIGLGGHTAAIYAEMQATMRHLYRNVNIRFVFPGDTLPLHLGVASDPAFPGGVRTVPGVYYSETIGSELMMDPEQSMRDGAPTPYGAGVLGRNHEPGDQPAPLNAHSVARSLIHRFAGGFTEVGTIEAAATAGTLSAADMALAARMYGRIIGENAAHEVGHFTNNAFVEHDDTGGFMDDGSNRTFAARTGMTANATGPILSDAGRGAMNDLSPAMLRTFEEFLPIDPPIDQARLRVRGRVGSFSLGRNPGLRQGWVNRGGGMARAMSNSQMTIHLPGATVLSGWQAEAFVAALQAAASTAAGPTMGPAVAASFGAIDSILAACDRFNVTVAVGTSYGGALQAGGAGGHGVVLAPGNRIGFYGALNGIVGHIYGATVALQITLIFGGPELFSGAGFMEGISVSTLGWYPGNIVDAPIAGHRVYSAAHTPIGYSLEFGIGVGVPVLSLIEAYGQQTNTVTTFGRRPQRHPGHGRAFAVDTTSQAYRAAYDEAMAAGATPAEADGFLHALFA